MSRSAGDRLKVQKKGGSLGDMLNAPESEYRWDAWTFHDILRTGVGEEGRGGYEIKLNLVAGRHTVIIGGRHSGAQRCSRSTPSLGVPVDRLARHAARLERYVEAHRPPER